MMIYKVIYKAIMASNGTIMYLLFHNVFINDSRPNVSGKVSYVSELMQSLTFSIIVVILSNAKNPILGREEKILPHCFKTTQ